MAKLYELTQNYNNLLELMDDPEIPAEMLTGALNSIEEEITVKAENIAKLIKSLEVDAIGIREEEIRLQNRRRATENKIAGLKAYLDEAMRATGTDKIKGNIFTIGYQKNPPSVEILNGKAIPGKYLIPQEATINKKMILAELKEGQTIPGTAIKQGTSLRIR